MATQKNQTATKTEEEAATKPEEANVQPLPIGLDVRINSIYPPNTDSKLRATASANMNGCFAVRGLKVYEGPKGLFVNMPSYKAASGKFKDYCYPVTKEFRDQLNKAVIDAFKQAVTQQGQAPVNGSAEPEPVPAPMKVDVRITTLTLGSENQRASASVSLNDSFALKGVRIMEGENGLYVSTPGYKSGDEYKEHYFPTTKEFRDQLHDSVLTAYAGAIAQTAEQDFSGQGQTALAAM